MKSMEVFPAVATLALLAAGCCAGSLQKNADKPGPSCICVTIKTHADPTLKGDVIDISVRNIGGVAVWAFVAPLHPSSAPKMPFTYYGGDHMVFVVQAMERQPLDYEEPVPTMGGHVGRIEAAGELTYSIQIPAVVAEQPGYNSVFDIKALDSIKGDDAMPLGGPSFRCTKLAFVQAYWRADEMPDNFVHPPDAEYRSPVADSIAGTDGIVVPSNVRWSSLPTPAEVRLKASAIVNSSANTAMLDAIDLQHLQTTSTELPVPIVVVREH